MYVISFSLTCENALFHVWLVAWRDVLEEAQISLELLHESVSLVKSGRAFANLLELLQAIVDSIDWADHFKLLKNFG